MEKDKNNLYILAFDQRSSLIKALFDKQNITSAEKKLVGNYKRLIFDGFLNVWKNFDEQERKKLAVLVDEEFGSAVIKSAKRKKISFALSQEKSGKQTVAFEYGSHFGEKIKKIRPDFVKILVRYNARDKEENKKQLKKLKEMSVWCLKNNYIFLVELLVPANERDLLMARGKLRIFDERLRPQLACRAIVEFYDAGIFPDIWKIEALSSKAQWQELLPIIYNSQKGENVSVIMLGRNASVAQVKKWMAVCPRPQVSGFAIGRTIWLRAILDLHKKKINRKQAVKQIARNYFEFIKLWEKNDK